MTVQHPAYSHEGALQGWEMELIGIVDVSPFLVS